jgi:hypothetical protein
MLSACTDNVQDCKLCNYGPTCTLQACARHIFSKCSKATPQHQQELLDLLSSSDDLDVLQPHAVAAFQAAQVQQLQRQQAWREQQEQQLAVCRTLQLHTTVFVLQLDLQRVPGCCLLLDQ